MPLRAAGFPIHIPSTMSAPGAPPAKVLPITRVIQQQDNWCWAACSQMLFAYFGVAGGVTQCAMASWNFAPLTCCQSPVPGGCDRGAWPGPVLANWGVPSTWLNTPLAYASLQAQIVANRPMIAYYEWIYGGSHVAVITGYYNPNEVHVNDPWSAYSYGRIAYSFLASAYGLGTWSGTYTT
jgi:hypothetical protein